MYVIISYKKIANVKQKTMVTAQICILRYTCHSNHPLLILWFKQRNTQTSAFHFTIQFHLEYINDQLVTHVQLCKFLLEPNASHFNKFSTLLHGWQKDNLHVQILWILKLKATIMSTVQC